MRTGKTEALRRIIAARVDAGQRILVITPDGDMDGEQWLKLYGRPQSSSS